MTALIGFYRDTLSSPIIWLLCGMIIADVLLGNVYAWTTPTPEEEYESENSNIKAKKGQFTSKKGIAGFIKHFGILFVTLLILPLLTAVLGSNGIPVSIAIYLIYLYAISILETLAKMGIPIPENIKSRLTQVVESEIKVKVKDVDSDQVKLKIEQTVDTEGNPIKEKESK